MEFDRIDNDGLELDTPPGSLNTPAAEGDPEVRRRGIPPWSIFLALALVVGLGVWWFFLRSTQGPEVVTTAPPPPPPSASQGSQATMPPPSPALDLPVLAESDPVVRTLVGGLSRHPQLARWLVTDDLISRFVVVVDNIARDESPRTHLPFLEPKGGFRVREAAGGAVMDEAGYARYDMVADVAASLDVPGTLALYRGLAPLIEEAYRNLGYPDGSFQAVLQRAIGRLLAVPVLDRPAALEQDVTTWLLRDPELESLAPAQKHLLRMGPENIRAIQGLLRELAPALEGEAEGGP